jgi:hypothetical protein
MTNPPTDPGPADRAGPELLHYVPGRDALPDSLLTSAPSGSPAVLLLAAGDDRAWSAQAALGVAAAWARGQRVVLVDLDLDDARLHEHAGVENRDGIVDVFLYGVSLARSAQPVRDRGFYLIPSGTYTPDVEDLYRHPRWNKLLSGLRDTGAALLLYVRADAPDVPALGAWAREVIVLGDDGGAWAQQLPPHWTVRAVLVPGDGAPPAAGGSGGPEISIVPIDAAYEREEDDALPIAAAVAPRRRRWWVTPMLALALLAVLAAGATYAALTQWPEIFGRAEPVPAATGSANPVQPVVRPPPAQPAGEPAPYAVRTQAFSTLAAAWEQAAENRRRVADVDFYVSTEEIQRHLYYKVLAGLLTDTAAANALGARLVQGRVVDTDDAAGGASLIQLVPLSFELGALPTREAAAQRVDSLYTRQIPAYAAEVPYSDGSTRWHIYAGAFRDSASADVMRQSLAEQNVSARLVERRAGGTTPRE